ncbi:uncharacterized protein LTR77_010345 [Saxophila tyrrhenica]|uniref:Uncharacterized protein n=1 Tax=Saxophila tyrrhenica TaxID=1690608 RepID=A0AAV9NWC2_9PEZI|nr:hypothetical protein LTR77_010345 [Saxophila tyrrhenica]
MFWRGVKDDAHYVWGEYIPQQAVKHPFLMHGILAATAMHMSHQQGHRAAHYLRLSDKHQTVALGVYRSVLATDINSENADALFALASLISVSAMARACIEAEAADPPGTMNMESVTEFFFLTRGVRDVISVTHEHIQRGPMVALFDIQRMPEGVKVTLPPSVGDQFVAIDEMLHSWGLDPDALATCETALKNLQQVYQTIVYYAPTQIIENATVWIWPIQVPSPFVRLVQACCQPALVIFAHFAAIAAAVRMAWYNQNWSVYAINGVSVALDESMKHWVDWPRAQAKDLMAVLGVRQPGADHKRAGAI